MRLFSNLYLRELSDEFGASPSHVKSELDQLKKADLPTIIKMGRQIFFSANQKHPMFNELHSMVQKALGMNRILDSIVMRLVNLEQAFVIDD